MGKMVFKKIYIQMGQHENENYPNPFVLHDPVRRIFRAIVFCPALHPGNSYHTQRLPIARSATHLRYDGAECAVGETRVDVDPDGAVWASVCVQDDDLWRRIVQRRNMDIPVVVETFWEHDADTETKDLLYVDVRIENFDQNA